MSYLFIILESEVRSVTFSFFRVSNIHHSSHKFIISCQWFLKQWISVLQYCVHGSVSAKVLLVCWHFTCMCWQKKNKYEMWVCLVYVAGLSRVHA